MSSYIQIKEYAKKKYLIVAGINTVVTVLSVWIMNYVYGWLGWYVGNPLDITMQAVIAYLIIGYAIAYLHERIPRCTSPRIEAIVRYTGMVLLLTAPFVYLLILPYSIFEWLYWADAIFALAGIQAIVTVWCMYTFFSE